MELRQTFVTQTLTISKESKPSGKTEGTSCKRGYFPNLRSAKPLSFLDSDPPMTLFYQ